VVSKDIYSLIIFIGRKNIGLKRTCSFQKQKSYHRKSLSDERRKSYAAFTDEWVKSPLIKRD